MAGRKNATFAVTKVRLGEHAQVDTRADTVAGEEPLEIRVGGQTITTTMRTPGHDIELAHGFLHSEGHIAALSNVTTARYCGFFNANIGVATHGNSKKRCAHAGHSGMD